MRRSRFKRERRHIFFRAGSQHLEQCLIAVKDLKLEKFVAVSFKSVTFLKARARRSVCSKADDVDTRMKYFTFFIARFCYFTSAIFNQRLIRSANFFLRVFPFSNF